MNNLKKFLFNFKMYKVSDFFTLCPIKYVYIGRNKIRQEVFGDSGTTAAGKHYLNIWDVKE